VDGAGILRPCSTSEFLDNQPKYAFAPRSTQGDVSCCLGCAGLPSCSQRPSHSVLRLFPVTRRRKVAGAAPVGVGAAVAGVAVVGMAAVGVVGNFWIKKAGRRRNQFLRSSATRRPHQGMGHPPRNSLTSPNKWGRTERSPSLETSMLIGEHLQVIMAIVSRM
jgi:hypothetical protein